MEGGEVNSVTKQRRAIMECVLNVPSGGCRVLQAGVDCCASCGGGRNLHCEWPPDNECVSHATPTVTVARGIFSVHSLPSNHNSSSNETNKSV